MMKQRRRDQKLHQDQPDLIPPQQSPLAIPELLEIVGRFLDRHSLTLCLRVCRQWHQVLSRQVWEVIKMYLAGGNPPEPKKSDGPSLLLLNNHADLVEELFLKIHTGDVNFPGQDRLYCPRLTELTVVTTGFQEPEHVTSFLEKNLAPFIMEHQATLKKLVLRVTISDTLMEAITSCSQLECLKSRVPYFKKVKELDGWIDWYETQGYRLKSLILLRPRSSQSRTKLITKQTMQELLSKASVSSLESLELRGAGPAVVPFEFQMMLVMKSPRLKRLSWPVFDPKGVFARLAEGFKECRPDELFCQELEVLSIPNHGEFDFKDFQRVMESLPALMDLTLVGYQEISTEVPSYLTTLSRLRKLSIDRCGWATPSVVQEILCSMPNLEVLVADSLSDIAIHEDPRPWVCTGLRELTLSFFVRSGPPFSIDGRVEARMLDRLCQLERLQKLKFPSATLVTSHDGWGTDPFRFLIQRGLDKLKTLSQLRIFEAPVGQLWTEAEARWALKNWTQLKEIDIHMDSKAKELLRDRLMKRPLWVDNFKF